MKKQKISISDKILNDVFELLKSDTNASKITIAQVLNISRMTVHRAVKELVQKKWIKEKLRIGIVVQYQIIKKD